VSALTFWSNNAFPHRGDSAATAFLRHGVAKMTPGQAAFEKWRARFAFTNKPQYWATLSPKAKADWEQVAQAAIEQHIGNSDMADLMTDKMIIGENTGEIRGILND
jgi:hypothetical protein